MKQGLYRISLQTGLGADTAVVVLNDGRMLGGDSRFAYIGDYTFSGDSFSAQLFIRQIGDAPGMATALGLLPVTLQLKGKISGDHIDATGAAHEYPERECQAEFAWLES
ncbi:MAG: GrlR family regulatory protein [Pseudomonadota bacterium]